MPKYQVEPHIEMEVDHPATTQVRQEKDKQKERQNKQPGEMENEPQSAPAALAANANIFQLLLSKPELIPAFAAQLDIDSLVNIYAMSAPFRTHCHTHWTHLCKSWAQNHAPIFWKWAPFSVYFSLNRLDPSGGKLRADPDTPRQAATFRYLRFIEYRQRTVRFIVRELARHGHRLPSAAKIVLAKMWFIMDMSDNTRRIACLRGASWSDKDLLIATLIIVKLEMRFAVPWDARSGMLRNFMMAQRGLGRLAQFLRRDILVSEADLLVMMAEWQTVLPRQLGGGHWLGVPIMRMGTLDREHHIPGNKALVGVDHLIGLECVKRNMQVKRLYTSMVLWGYVDKFGRDVDVFLKDDEDEDAIDNIMPETRTRAQFLKETRN